MSDSEVVATTAIVIRCNACAGTVLQFAYRIEIAVRVDRQRA